VDRITKGQSRTPSYLAMNPQGQVPFIDFGGGKGLAQSNAIIRHLARGSSLLPDDSWTQAKIDEWLFWEQYSHEPYVAVCRYHMVYLGKPKETRDSVKVERGERALDFMERQLHNRAFLVGDSMTIADISLLAYTRVADEGGFELALRPNLRAWIARCEVGSKM
jgi:glutathione S-transferase